MKHVIESGTDGGTLTLFDPAALPDTFEEKVQDDFGGCCDALEKEGRLAWISPGGDGSYLLHVYEDEAVPESLAPHLREPIVVEQFQIPSGRLYFTGGEYAFAKDDSQLKKYSHMGGSISVRPGTWRLTIYRTEYPPDLIDELLRSRVGSRAYRVHESIGCLVGIAVLAVLAGLVLFFKLNVATWSVTALPFALAAVALPLFLTRLKTYRETDRKMREIERDYPSIVAVLKTPS